MDSFLWAFPDSKNGGYECNHGSVSAYSDSNVVKGFQLKDTSLDYNVVDLPLTSNVSDPVIHCTDVSNRLDRDSADENGFSDAVLRFVNQVLMEDDSEDKDCTIQDFTLHAAEKSFYEILNEKYPSLPSQPLHHDDPSSSLDECITHCCSNCSGSSISPNNSIESSMITDLHKYESSQIHNPYIDHTLPTNSQSFCSSGSSGHTGLVESLLNPVLESRSSWQFNKGIEETEKILSLEKNGNLVDQFYSEASKSGSSLTYFENQGLTHPVSKEKVLKVKPDPEKDEVDLPDSSLLKGRKNHHREESDLEEGRSNKHLAVYTEESVLHEMFDKVLSLYGNNAESGLNPRDGGAFLNGSSWESQQNELTKGLNCEMIYAKKGVSKREAVDMRNLLIQCMQSVANNDHQSARKLLRQIRWRSSPRGDGSQRMAHYFANSLEARLVGTGSSENRALAASMSYVDVLKAYKLFLSTFPFMESSHFFATQMVMERAAKVTSLHIIHFGAMSGVQWIPLIQRLSTRPGGSPKLRITGIDFPQVGFRPAARVNETGCRLAKYCEKFNVPFEYNGIAQKWETVNVEDLGIEKDELLVVNCLYHLMHILDETIMQHSPRDAVLNLILRINPDIFIHGIVNGNYNSPFFVSRFREALFHFSAFFDMLEANVPRENHERMVFERDIWGKEILNVVACEGLERTERPETYKHWQIRMLRAGFKQLLLNQEIVKQIRTRVKSNYHKDFFVDDASQWMLSGWKGRALFALSCWKPA